MKKYIFIMAILLIGLPSFGQHVRQLLGSGAKNTIPGMRSNLHKWQDSTNYKLNVIPDYFMLGTFSDYLDRFNGRNKEINIDEYGSSEKALFTYLAAFLEDNYQVKIEKKIYNDIQSELNNPQLAQHFNTFYTDDGHLIDENFDKDESRKYSFLLGLYIRYGERVYDDVYKIRIINSSKDKILYPLLKDLGCNKIYYKMLRNFIPVSEYFYFEATPIMIKYFKTVDSIKADDLNVFVQHPFLKNLREEDRKEMERVMMENKEKEMQMLKNWFSANEF
ncbi:hypothetical protein ACR780_19145 [Sphingobacterium faecium]|uniref:hypothetical protein n=1 Tax=Sphingobacterium faecium TaxID=34087 RepID=UPI003DA436DD